MTTTWAIKFCGSFAPRSGVGISCSLTLCGVVNGTYLYVRLLDPIHSRGKQTTQFVAFSIFFFCHVYNMVLLLCVVRGESSSLSPSCNIYLMHTYMHKYKKLTVHTSMCKRSTGVDVHVQVNLEHRPKTAAEVSQVGCYQPIKAPDRE